MRFMNKQQNSRFEASTWIIRGLIDSISCLVRFKFVYGKSNGNSTSQFLHTRILIVVHWPLALLRLKKRQVAKSLTSLPWNGMDGTCKRIFL